MPINQLYNNKSIKSITFRCYAELNDFLPNKRKYTPFIIPLKTQLIVSEAIASLGIPLSEVDLILVNGKQVERNHKLTENDYISVYPTFETFDISSLKTTQKEALRKTKFIADAHLGKLSKYLRMLGFDTLYKNDFGDEEIIKIAVNEKRIILTRDKLLLKSKRITHGYYVRATDKHKQLIEIVKKFDLNSQFKPFTRCMTCNARLVPKSLNEVKHLIDSRIAQQFSEFYFCPDCKKVFWKGSHFKRMESIILNIANMNE